MAQPFPNELKHLYDNAEFIGSGGFARVFKARRRDGRVVAVKIPLSLDEATGKSFLREITSWQRLSHKNIVSLFDANILPIPYLEQEYCDGGSLESLKKPLDIAKACEIVFDIAEGLKYAHKQGIVHRDLKPQNILLTKDNVPKITDWGMSRIIAESRSSTQHGYTPAYASPEQVSPKKFGKPDERTDIYQLGVIFYNLLTDDLPFKGDDLAEIASAIVMEKPAAPSELNPEARKVEHIVLRCLMKNKEERYQSVEALQMELAGFIKQRKEREKKALEKLQQETARREKEKANEDEEKRLRIQREEQESIAREREKAEQKKETSWKGVFAAALVLFSLLLGYWALAPSANNVPETLRSTPLLTPDVTATVIQTSKVTPTVSPTPIVSPTPQYNYTTVPVDIEPFFNKQVANSEIKNVFISQDGEYIAVASQDNNIPFFDKNGTNIWNTTFHEKPTDTATSGKDTATNGDYTVTGYSEKKNWGGMGGVTRGYVSLDSKSGEVIFDKAIEPDSSLSNPILHVAITTDGNTIVASDPNHVYFLNKSGYILKRLTIDGHINGVVASSFIAVFSENTVYLYDSIGRMVQDIKVENGIIKDVSISDDEYTAALTQQKIYLYNKDKKLWEKSAKSGSFFTSISISTDGKWVAVSSTNDGMFFFDKNGVEVLRNPTNFKDISTNGKLIAGVRYSNLYLFDAQPYTYLK